MTIEYFSTRDEALNAAKQAMKLISSKRVWTGTWEECEDISESYGLPKRELLEWTATDGLVSWKVSIGLSFDIEKLSGWSTTVVIEGEDQMSFNWSIPGDGNIEQVIKTCLYARQVCVDGGEIWSWMWRLSDDTIQNFLSGNL